MILLLAVVTACTPAGPQAAGVQATVNGDGSIPENESISLDDGEHAAIANLDPALLAAMRKAAADARLAGVELRVTSGWRSAEHQQRLLDEAVELYRSEEEARRWVHPPDRSAHVTGKAIDIGPTNADDWLIQHGADYGLCQAYANEMWHFELLTTPGGQCPQPRSTAG
ncbi:M15 family metallopeptidase [Lentzea sp. NEAU-D7]|uniref:M15 family metallopeptidase n=1 Tax=Lentzea sp. NEAU-D7 TaxID=2994667 RepID=UPI00224A7AA1|nr:M15 family metallopeptidase [Lentzea sp. NEAU-D7]MCX2955305.1 M15 family metallopeptidase [Lentzea sp. NEAU-D7]